MVIRYVGVMRFLLDQGDGAGEPSLQGRVVFGPLASLDIPHAGDKWMAEEDLHLAPRVHPGEYCWTLRSDIHEWLAGHQIPYRFLWTTWEPRREIREDYTMVWVVDLQCSRDLAALFKLTWL